MNLIDFHVREIVSEPYEEYGKWWVKVIADCGYHDHEEKHTIMFPSELEAKNVKVGYVFQA